MLGTCLDDFFERFVVGLGRGQRLLDIPENHVEVLIVRLRSTENREQPFESIASVRVAEHLVAG